MILLFKTTKGITSGATKGLKIDTTAKTYKNGYYTLTISELMDATTIKNKDYEKIITQLKNENYQKCVID